ncbi:hypothetical protein Marpi_1459 [Marinitoga piezophila KA3]|uniref:Uncharacterized protein n=1 Tax=Marinitoga piezophila (strain DSM 14283 / JCM 11233 / KA3) TaxID=443254 RepID=H2J3W2_MARPK|nr:MULTISPECIES: hypothetical protein [Marinitoga]AEX85854.1 hypothetical protein Marpi_1459 [Marinitoga piezophila KA3]APT76292.1 hypothetical protein LN42_07780 [Marinitoga sp. 1137]NUU97968.1 hypothetical protein [Marinitoga sp. 1138]
MKKTLILFTVLIISAIGLSFNLDKDVANYYYKISQTIKSDIKDYVENDAYIKINTFVDNRSYDNFKNNTSGYNVLQVNQFTLPIAKYSAPAFTAALYTFFNLMKSNNDVLFYSFFIPIGVDFYLLFNPSSSSLKNTNIDNILFKNILSESFNGNTPESKKKKFYSLDIYVHNITINYNFYDYSLFNYTVVKGHYIVSAILRDNENNILFQKTYNNSDELDKLKNSSFLSFIMDVFMALAGTIFIFESN